MFSFKTAGIRFNASVLKARSALAQRFKSTAAEAPSTSSHGGSYSGAVQLMHWSMGGSVLGCFAYVNMAQQTKDKKLKMDYMFMHKSFGTLAAGLLMPRLIFRMTSKSAGQISQELWVRALAGISHLSMYGFLILMPLSGVAMGWFGGKGLPFFNTTIPGAQGDAKDGKLAGRAFKVHKQFGWYMELLFMGHIGGVAFHALRGEAIFARILPLGK